MKRIIFAILIIASLESCSKKANYTCYDTYTDADSNVVPILSGIENKYFPTEVHMKRYQQYYNKICIMK